MEDKNVTVTVNVSGGMLGIARGNSTIRMEQNNGVNADELDKIVKEIMDNLSGLNKDDADSISDIVDMVQTELAKKEPKKSRLRNCLSLMAPMFTVANGIPILLSNLHKLEEYITPFI